MGNMSNIYQKLAAQVLQHLRSRILTRINLLEGAAQPDVVQTAGALGDAGADVGELGRGHQGPELLLSQRVQLRTLGRGAKVSHHHQLLLSCTQSTAGWSQSSFMTNSRICGNVIICCGRGRRGRLTSQGVLDAGGEVGTPDFLGVVAGLQVDVDHRELK